MKEEESGDVGLEEEVQEVPALHRALRQEIYSRKEADQDSLLWVITENMTARIMEDCLGGDLYSQLKEKVKNNKINLEFDFGKGYSYNWEEHTLHIGLEELEANNLLHEMFHVFQTTQEPISSFKKFYDEQRDRSALCAIPVLTKERGVDGQKTR